MLALFANLDCPSLSTCLFHHDRALNISLESQSAKMGEFMRVSNCALIEVVKEVIGIIREQEWTESQLFILEGMVKMLTCTAPDQAKGLDPPAAAEHSLMVSSLMRVRVGVQ